MKKILLFLLILLGMAKSASAGYVEGEEAFKSKHYAQAFNEFLPLADDGDFRSQYYIAHMYISGLGTTQNPELGLKYLQLALDQDYDMAQSLMAYLYSEGTIVPQDKKKAIQLYEEAAAQNNISANLNLGVMYYTGDYVPQNYQTALEYFQKVPIEERPVVSRYLGDIYLNNPSLRDYQKAHYYYELSARQNDLSAYYNLGEMYRKGQGVSTDSSLALTYYKYAASQGYAPAQYMLGIIYANGEGVSRDTHKAYAWLQLAAEQGLKTALLAQKKLQQHMVTTDEEAARHQVVLIQQTEIGKIEQPLKPIEQTKQEVTNQSKAETTAKTTSTSRRRSVRRRRR